MNRIIQDLKDWPYLTREEKIKYSAIIGILFIVLLVLLRTANNKTSNREIDNSLTETESGLVMSGSEQGPSNRELTAEEKNEAFVELMEGSDMQYTERFGDTLLVIEPQDVGINPDDPNFDYRELTGPERYFYDPGMTFYEYRDELYDYYIDHQAEIDYIYQEYRTDYYIDKQEKYERAKRLNPDSNNYQ